MSVLNGRPKYGKEKNIFKATYNYILRDSGLCN